MDRVCSRRSLLAAGSLVVASSPMRSQAQTTHCTPEEAEDYAKKMASRDGVVGLAGGLYLSGFVKGLLHEVYPTDAFSIAMPIGGLLLTAFFAAVPAARRASRLDPVEALRSE